MLYGFCKKFASVGWGLMVIDAASGGLAFPLSSHLFLPESYALVKLKDLVRGHSFLFQDTNSSKLMRKEPTYVHLFLWVINRVNNYDGLPYFISGNDRIMNPNMMERYDYSTEILAGKSCR